VQSFSEIYDEREETHLERRLFGQVSAELQHRGFYEIGEFHDVCDWKTTRTRSLVRSNSREDVEEISRIAFSSSEHLKVPILSILRGVNMPTASALLTVWRPDLYTIIDVRVLSALRFLSHPEIDGANFDGIAKSYSAYVSLMRAISSSLGTDLRSLDKAMWTYDKTRVAS